MEVFDSCKDLLLDSGLLWVAGREQGDLIIDQEMKSPTGTRRFVENGDFGGEVEGVPR